MRTALAIVTGIAIGVAAATMTFVAVERRQATPADVAPPAHLSSTPVGTTPADASQAIAGQSQAAPASRSRRAVPVTPDYGPLPDTTKPIYRCRSRSGTEYSNEPCAGASVVDGSSAVGGYDTRPSDKLARLVAEGRGAVDAVGPVPVVAARGAPIRESVECANQRRQIRDIDAAALRPNSVPALDELRRIRQDVVTGMARSGC